MSNSSLFIKSGFPRAPLQNGLGRYVPQLARITLKFCKNNGSSRGMREFIENDLVEFAKVTPGTVVYVKPRRHRTPVMVAEFLNGEREWVNCRNNTREEINKWINILKQQHGPAGAIRFRKMWHTDVPSIQGPWTPFLHRHPEQNLVEFPNKEYSGPLRVEKSATEKVIEMMNEYKKEQK